MKRVVRPKRTGHAGLWFRDPMPFARCQCGVVVVGWVDAGGVTLKVSKVPELSHDISEIGRAHV